MAHDLEQNHNGEYEMFVAGEPAWHHLGTNVKEALTWKDAVKTAGLDWYVQKHQLQFKGQNVDVWGTFRADSGKFLGAVGPDYAPIQNVKGFEFTNTLLQSHDVKYESAGALGGGKKIWLLARIPKDIRIAGTDDVTKNYFLFTNPHDGSRAAIARTCNTRVVCNNTLQCAMKEKGDIIRIRHTKSNEEQMKAAKALMDGTLAQLTDLDSLLNVLAKTQLDMNSIQGIIRKVYKDIENNVQDQNKARTVLELFEDNDKNAFPSQRGTAYNLLNAFTKYEDHFSSARITAQENEQQARARKAMFGIGDVLKYQVLTAITQTIHENKLAKIDTNLVTL
jgi:phage/plasmid-like protein (TIGR03299 family)